MSTGFHLATWKKGRRREEKGKTWEKEEENGKNQSDKDGANKEKKLYQEQNGVAVKGRT